MAKPAPTPPPSVEDALRRFDAAWVAAMERERPRKTATTFRELPKG